MPWLFPSLLANLAALTLEWIYRARVFPSWWDGWWVMLPLAAAVQVGLFYSFRSAPSLLVAWSTFFLVNAALRLFLSYQVLKEPLTPGITLGLVLVIIGALLLRG